MFVYNTQIKETCKAGKTEYRTKDLNKIDTGTAAMDLQARMNWSEVPPNPQPADPTEGRIGVTTDLGAPMHEGRGARELLRNQGYGSGRKKVLSATNILAEGLSFQLLLKVWSKVLEILMTTQDKTILSSFSQHMMQITSPSQ